MASSNSGGCCKQAAFIIVGVVTFLYVIAELGVAIWLHSLVLLSDGFHNLSDVLSLVIAFWASKVTLHSLLVLPLLVKGLTKNRYQNAKLRIKCLMDGEEQKYLEDL